jgi:C-terminal processing protease CtpA/Prc
MGLLPYGTSAPTILRVRDATGPERTVPVPRSVATDGAARANAALMHRERTAPAVSRPAPDIAYLDLDRLDSASAASALAGAMTARAIIVDLRGGAAAWRAVLPRLVTRPEFVMARVVQHVASVPCMVATVREAQRECADERITHPAVVRTDTAGHYRGRVVVLIDERTQGEAEQLALALESGASATLVGSASAGAAADVVHTVLPGGLVLSYPPEELRRADGGQLHRTGLTPVVNAVQTVKGFRAGKDDVIERAREWLQPAPEPVRRRR